MHKRLTLISLASSLCLSAACATTPDAGPPPDSPRFEYGRVRTTAQTLADFTVTFDAVVHNPTASAITLEKATFELSTGDDVLADGEQSLGVVVPAGSSAELTLPASVHYARDADEIHAFAETKKLPLLMEAEVKVSGGADLVFSRAGAVRSPRLPYAKLGEPDAARQRQDAIAATFRLEIHNDNPFEITLGQINYALTVEGVSLDSGVLGQGERVPPSSTAVYEIPTGLTEETLPGIAAIVKEKNGLDFELKGSIEIEGITLDFAETSSITFTAERE